MRRGIREGIAVAAVLIVAGGQVHAGPPPPIDITVEPATELSDGATVAVTASGLPPGTYGVGQCLIPCGEQNAGNFSTSRVSDDGNLNAELTVTATLTNDGGLNADCTTEPCAVFVTNLGGAGETGEAPIEFTAGAAQTATSTAGDAAPAESATSVAGEAAPAAAVPQSLIDAAMAEGGELSLYEAGIGTAVEEPAFEALFEEMYGFPIDITFTPATSMPQNAAQLIQEFEADQTTQQDAFIGTETHFLDLNAAGVLQTLDPAELPNTDGFLQAGDTAVPVVSRIPGITYNSEAVSAEDVPTTLDEILAAAESGEFTIASTPFAAGFPTLGADGFLGEQGAIDFTQSFVDAAQPGLIFCGSLEQEIGGGAFDMIVFDCGNTEANAAAERGAPVAFQIVNDFATVGHWYYGVPVNSGHPATAKLFVNMMLTREAQDAWYEGDQLDLHSFPGSNTAAEIAEFEAEGAEFVVTDIAWAEENPVPFENEFREMIQATMRGEI